MPHDFWLDDDESGCLECGSLTFRASRVSGICVSCYEDSLPSATDRVYGEEDDNWMETW